MDLLKLIDGLEYELIKGSLDRRVEGIIVDSRQAAKGLAFVCIKGFVYDGHNFAYDVIEGGGQVIFVENHIDYEGDYTLIKVKDTRKSLAFLADRFYGHPSAKLRVIGVTGTKGKTSTTFYLKSIFEKAAIKTGLIGSMYNMIGDQVLSTERTTPESLDLQRILADMISQGIKVCLMEVSSQGIKLDRVAYIEYTSGIFTNLSPDHIGENEHPDMEDYARTKASFFSMCEKAVINIDSQYFNQMAQKSKETYTYGIEKDCDFRAINIIRHIDSIEYDLVYKDKIKRVNLSSPGTFSVYNSLSAIATAYIEGIDLDIAIEGVKDVKIKGKAELVPIDKDYTVLIDYAHNPDSFKNIITTVKEYAKRCVFLFGAGGDRNRPRELMGQVAGEYADFSIITSDNPRTEDPKKICEDIERGIKKTKGDYIVIVERKEAIEYALRHARPGDVIVLAGKGHETYQIFADKLITFDEREIVSELVKKIDGENDAKLKD